MLEENQEWTEEHQLGLEEQGRQEKQQGVQDEQQGGQEGQQREQKEGFGVQPGQGLKDEQGRVEASQDNGRQLLDGQGKTLWEQMTLEQAVGIPQSEGRWLTAKILCE